MTMKSSIFPIDLSGKTPDLSYQGQKIYQVLKENVIIANIDLRRNNKNIANCSFVHYGCKSLE